MSRATASEAPAYRWRDLFRDSYLTLDRRTLGLTRIFLGFFLITDLFRRTGDWEAMFSDRGVLPTWVILHRPQSTGFSLLHGFTTAPELWALWAVILATYVCLLVGYRTKLAQVLSLVFVTSMNGRVLLIENGGYVVHNLLLLWTAFMPLGDRFSLDALLDSLRRRREASAAELADRGAMETPYRMTPFVSLVGLVLVLQLSAVYYFNVVHKTGPAWKVQYTAVHYVMYVDRMVNPLIGLVRDHVPFPVYRLMTMAVMASEAALPFCLLAPRVVIGGFDTRLWLRRFALVLVNFLHIGFGSTFVLGPFAWALCVFSTLLLQKEDWDTTIRAMRRTHRERTVIFDPGSGAAWLAARVLARMDRFGLLGFDEARGAEASHGFAVLDRSGKLLTGHAAVADAIAALPVGPVLAAIVRLPVVSSIVDAALQRGRWSSFFGLRPPSASVEHPTSPVFERRRRLGALVREAACFVMMIGALNQALTELWVTKKGWNNLITELNKTSVVKSLGVELSPHPEVTKALSHKGRFLQGWFMFSPNPVMDDGTIIVDAVTVDGRHVDPFWGVAPNFDLKHAKSFGYNQIWSDYFNRMHLVGNRNYRDAMVEYMRRLPERTKNPNDALVSGEVYWVKDMNPKWGTRESYAEQRDLLFTFGAEGGAKEPPREPKSTTGS
jgi:hypothetical protein